MQGVLSPESLELGLRDLSWFLALTCIEDIYAWKMRNDSFGLCIPGGSEVKASACNVGDLGSIPESGRSPGEGNGNPLQYSCLENPMDGGAWWAEVHGVAKSWTRLSDLTFIKEAEREEVWNSHWHSPPSPPNGRQQDMNQWVLPATMGLTWEQNP